MTIDHSDRKKLHGAAKVSEFRLRQYAKFDGVLLPAIADQVLVDKPEGGREHWSKAKWKRALALGYGIKGSTTKLADDAYAAFVWWVETNAIPRMGVRIPEQRRPT